MIPDPHDENLGEDVSSPEAPKVPAREAPDFFINTAPEMDALERAAADGKHGHNYTADEQMGTRRHQVPGSSHFVELSLSLEEQRAGLTTQALESLTSAQDADSALAFLYISHVLATPNSGIVQEFAGGKIDFDDVISKIGWDPRSSAERREMHRRIYEFITFGERAHVIGRRRGAYKDKHTGELIDTELRTPLWRVLTDETPAQKSLFPQEEVPIRVDLVLSREWTKLLTSPRTAQYLPMGERLGAIPGNKASGAWARIIGLALGSFWRRNPRESLEGSLKPTRRELLTRYPPKTGPVEELLASKNPRLAIDYWCGALAILVEKNLLQNSGEASIPVAEMRKQIPRQGWQEAWLDERVVLMPGLDMSEAVAGRAKVLPAAPVPKKRGRPRKIKE